MSLLIKPPWTIIAYKHLSTKACPHLTQTRNIWPPLFVLYFPVSCLPDGRTTPWWLLSSSTPQYMLWFDLLAHHAPPASDSTATAGRTPSRPPQGEPNRLLLDALRECSK